MMLKCLLIRKSLSNLDDVNKLYATFRMMFNVTPILNVSRKFSMRIIFSTGYIKIYNINSTNEYFIQQNAFVQSTTQILHVQSIKIFP